MRGIDHRKHVFNTYYKRLCLFAHKLVGDMDMAEDIVQDAIFSYFNKEDEVSSDSSVILQYLYSSVRFIAYNKYRRDKIHAKYWEQNPFTEMDEYSLENEIIYVEALAKVQEIITTMPQACATIFRMGYLEELSNKEIAESLNISVNTVKTQKQRGMKILLSKLDPEYLPFLSLLFFE